MGDGQCGSPSLRARLSHPAPLINLSTADYKHYKGLLIIKPDPLDDMGLVDIDASLFTAHNEPLAAVDAEMKRLRALSSQQPRPVRTRSRETPEPGDTDAPSPRQRRRAA